MPSRTGLGSPHRAPSPQHADSPPADKWLLQTPEPECTGLNCIPCSTGLRPHRSNRVRPRWGVGSLWASLSSRSQDEVILDLEWALGPVTRVLLRRRKETEETLWRGRQRLESRRPKPRDVRVAGGHWAPGRGLERVLFPDGTNSVNSLILGFWPWGL